MISHQLNALKPFARQVQSYARVEQAKYDEGEALKECEREKRKQAEIEWAKEKAKEKAKEEKEEE